MLVDALFARVLLFLVEASDGARAGVVHRVRRARNIFGITAFLGVGNSVGE